MKFIADGMLGRLTRWLRLAGHDVVLISEISTIPDYEDEKIIEKSKEESRIILTRDKSLHRQALRKNLNSILIEETKSIEKQLLTITESTGKKIEVEVKNSRCPKCNGEINQANKKSVQKDVPENIFENNSKFWRCEKCGKVYWIGGHWKKIEETIEKYNQMLR